MADTASVIVQPAPEEIDCSQVDVEQIEEIGMQLAQNVESFVMNIDITNIQFDAE